MKNTLLITLLLICSSMALAETIWLDVRSKGEYDTDHLVPSVHIPHKKINQLASSLLPDKEAEINVYCVAGYRAEKAKSALEELGYKNVTNVVSLTQARKLLKNNLK